MRAIAVLAVVLMPWAVFAQGQSTAIREAFAALPLPPDTAGQVVLRYGTPSAMRDMLGAMPASQAAFTAIARTLPSAISGQAAVLAQGQRAHRIDVFGFRQVAMMQGAEGTSMVLDLAEGQGAQLGPALEELFGYVPSQEGWVGDGAATLFSGGVPGASHLRIEGDRVIQASDARLFEGGSVPPAVDDLLEALAAATPSGAAAVQISIYLELPDGVGLPVRMLLVADITSGREDGVVIVGDPMGPVEISDFLASANGVLALGEMDVLLLGGLIVASHTVPRDPDQPPWRSVLTERVYAGLADGRFWREGQILSDAPEPGVTE